MSSPSRKGAASPTPKDADGGAMTNADCARAIIEVFHGVYGSEEEQARLTNEHRRMANHEKLLLEQQAEKFAERKRQRQQRFDAKKRADEERRLHEKRNNPENLAACAAQIQKYVKAMPVRRKYYELRSSTNERHRKTAIVILLDGFDDPRVREPAVVIQDGFELARALQHCGFAVDLYSSRSQNPKFKPTKANISRALDEAARNTPPDAALWVHICGPGGVSTVSGRNPLKAAWQEATVKQTPRTRMLRALQANHRTPGASGAIAGGGDICRFVFPCDGRSGRLTYDTIVSIDEVLMILDPRNMPSIFGRPPCQRIVTVDCVALGVTEGHQGGGYSLLASTLGPKITVELRPGEPGSTSSSQSKPMELVEPHRGILSAVLLRAVLGEGWVPVRKFDSDVAFKLRKLNKAAVQPTSAAKPGAGKGAASKPAAPAPARGVPGAPRTPTTPAAATAVDNADVILGCTVASITEAFKARCDLLGLAYEEAGRHTWGDAPIITGDAGSAFVGMMETMYGVVVDSMHGVAAVSGGVPLANASNASLSFGGTSRIAQLAKVSTKRRTPATTRQCGFEVTYTLNALAPDAVNTFDSDFLAALFQWTVIMCQPDHTAPAHRQLKLQPAKGPIRRHLLVGIAGNFVDIASRFRSHKGGEQQVWARLVERLTTPAMPAAAKGKALTTNVTGHVTLPPISGNASKYLAASQYNADESSPADSPSASSATPFFSSGGAAAAEDSEAQAFQVLLGHFEEGGVTVAIPVHSNAEVETVLKQLHVIPECLEGLRHQSVRLELSMELNGCPAAIFTLKHHCRGWYTPLVQEEDEAAQLARAKQRRSSAGGDTNHQSPSDFNPEEPTAAQAELGMGHIDSKAVAVLMDRLCSGTLKKPQQILGKILGPNRLAMSRVNPRVQRINDMDDAAFEAFRSRERPATISMPMPAQAGVAICVVAMVNPTAEQRARQAIELARVAPAYECFAGLRFLLWDAHEVLWTLPADKTQLQPGAHSQAQPAAVATAVTSLSSLVATHSDPSAPKREKVGKLLESLKGLIPSVNFPALLVLDLFKKRYYRTRLPNTSGANVFGAEQISHFCDDYCRGALSELLPPVKGCRVYGGSIASTKYTLIPV